MEELYVFGTGNAQATRCYNTCFAIRDGEEYFLPKEEELSVKTEGQSVQLCPDAGLTGYGVACDIGTTTVVCHLIRLSDAACAATVGEGNA